MILPPPTIWGKGIIWRKAVMGGLRGVDEGALFRR
jgi:hypothetical protein